MFVSFVKLKIKENRKYQNTFKFKLLWPDNNGIAFSCSLRIIEEKPACRPGKGCGAMYFEKAGKENTDEVLKLAVNTARERGIRHLVLASSDGFTPTRLPDCEGIQVVVVTTAYGSKEPNQSRVSEEQKAAFLAKGYQVCTAAHALSGAEEQAVIPFSRRSIACNPGARRPDCCRPGGPRFAWRWRPWRPTRA